MLELSIDLQLAIMNRLPVKSLLQFRLVSKLWKYSIDCSDFVREYGNKYILIAVDYLSKWVKAKALPTNDARVVVKFLKSLFSRFGALRAIISDRGTHFCNDEFVRDVKIWSHHRLSDSFLHLRVAHTIVMPIRITFDNPIDFNDHFSKPKDLKKDLTVSFDSSDSSILPLPLLDSDSPFTAELSASVTLNSLGNEDKVFKPGILVYHAIHDKNLVTLEENLKENISSGTLLVFKEPSFLFPPPEPPDKCLNFEPILVIKNVVLNEDFYQINVEDVNSFTIIIWIFLPYFTYTEESPLIFSFRSENFVFDPGIVMFHKPVDRTNKFFEASRVRLICPVLLELLILCVTLVWGNPISFHLID
ncbi:reverse transcriptase domain-containing protein [Tanacetum coccineum]